MIESFVLVSDYGEIERKYGVKNFYPGLKIPVPKVLTAGDEFWTITFDTPGYINTMPFGYTPEYSKEFKNTLNTFVDDPVEYFTNYRLMSSQYPRRCLVFIDAFLVKASDNAKYLIHLQNKQRAIGLAAIYGYWINFNSGVPYVGFAIFTVHSSPMFQNVGITELPVILTNENAHIWIGKDFRTKEIISLFNSNNDELLNGYPVRNNLSSGPVSRAHLQPIGNRLKPIGQNSKGTKLSVLKNENQNRDLTTHQGNNVIYLK